MKRNPFAVVNLKLFTIKNVFFIACTKYLNNSLTYGILYRILNGFLGCRCPKNSDHFSPVNLFIFII